jgi:hypothetical protein
MDGYPGEGNAAVPFCDMKMPPPDRVSAFETSAYVVAPA